MKKHRLISLFLALFLMISLIPMTVTAAEDSEYQVITRVEYPGVTSLGKMEITDKTTTYSHTPTVYNVEFISRDQEIVIVDKNDPDKVDMQRCLEIYPYRITSDGMAEPIGTDVYRLRNGELVKVTDDVGLKYFDTGNSLSVKLAYDDPYDKIHAGETVRFHLPFDDYDEPVIFEFWYEVVFSKSFFVEEDWTYFHQTLYLTDVAVNDIINGKEGVGEEPSGSSSGISVNVKGESVKWTDAEPFIDSNNRTLVPLRAVAEALGINVNWDSYNRQAIFNRNTQFIVFRIDNNVAISYNFDGVDQTNYKEIEMDTQAVIVNERTYAPVRYLAEYFGFSVRWDAEARAVVIG